MWKIFFLNDELSLYYSTFYIQNSTDSLHILSNLLFLTLSEMYRTSSIIVNWHSTLHWLSAQFRLPNLGRRLSASTSPAIVECVRRFDVTRLCVWLYGALLLGWAFFNFCCDCGILRIEVLSSGIAYSIISSSTGENSAMKCNILSK